MAAEMDIVLWGATGFTGQLVAEHLASTQRSHGARWALGGRSEQKLVKLREHLTTLEPACARLPIVVAAAEDGPALAALVQRTTVVCSAVGPYARHGSELVAAAARHGVAYCDLTGEIPWVRRMIDAHHGQAQKSGARIVHCCGFESLPADLGTFMLQEYMREQHGSFCTSVCAYLGQGSGGGVSGGTCASMLLMFDELAKNPELRRLIADPYGLNPAPRAEAAADRGQPGAVFIPELDAWTAPSVIAPLDTRVVRRSHALLGEPWGHDFHFDERMAFGAGPRARLMVGTALVGLKVAGAVLKVGALRRLLARMVPAPGQGPSAAVREKGSFEVSFIGKGLSARQGRQVGLRASMFGQGDPGYTWAARMLAQSALGLALDQPARSGGVLTPATALGAPLMHRLQKVGLSFEIKEF